MSGMVSKNIGKDAAYLSVAKIVIMGVSLLSNMLLSRFRTLEEYGTYSQINIIINLFTAFLMLGLPSSVNYFLSLAETGKERNIFLSVYYTLTISICFVIGLLIIAFLPLLESYFGNSQLKDFAYFFAIYPFVNVLISGIGNVYIVYDKSKYLAIVNFITALVALVSVLIAEYLGLSFNDYMFLFLIGNILISLVLIYSINQLDGRLRLYINKELIIKIFKYSIPIGFATLVGTINLEIDKLMIGNLLDTESLAIYANAGKELPLVFIAASLTSVLLPSLVRMLNNGYNKDAISLWGKTVTLSYIFMCFFCTACIVFAPQIVVFLYSDKYLPGVPVFIVYSLVLLLRVTYFGIVLSALGRTKLIMWSSIVALCINIVLNLLLYNLFSFIGPALASLISILVVNLAQLIWTAKIVNISFFSIFPWKDLWHISLVNILWGIIAYLLLKIFSINYSIRDIIVACVIGCVFLLLYSICVYKKIATLWKELNC